MFVYKAKYSGPLFNFLKQNNTDQTKNLIYSEFYKWRAKAVFVDKNDKTKGVFIYNSCSLCNATAAALPFWKPAKIVVFNSELLFKNYPDYNYGQKAYFQESKTDKQLEENKKMFPYTYTRLLRYVKTRIEGNKKLVCVHQTVMGFCSKECYMAFLLSVI